VKFLGRVGRGKGGGMGECEEGRRVEVRREDKK
jgi:hypothetical protein